MTTTHQSSRPRRASFSKLALLASLPAAFAACAVHAQSIGVTNSVTNFSTNAAAVSSFTFSDFSLGAGNALVVVINSEATTGTNSFSVSFGGQTVSSNVFTNEIAQAAGIFWIINPSVTSGDVVIDLGTTSRAGVSVLALSNVGGVSDSKSFTSSTNTLSFSIGYEAVAGGFVVAGYVDNGSNTATAPTISGGNIGTTLLSLNNNQSTSSSGIVQGYGSIGSTALATETFATSRNNSSNNRHAGALVAFSAIPEPSAFATFAGLAVVGAVALRRRRRA